MTTAILHLALVLESFFAYVRTGQSCFDIIGMGTLHIRDEKGKQWKDFTETSLEDGFWRRHVARFVI